MGGKWDIVPEVVATSCILLCPEAVKFSSLVGGGPDGAICGGTVRMPDGGLWENLGPRQSAKWSGKKKDDHQECISHTQVNGRWIKGSLPQTSKKPPCVFFFPAMYNC